MKTILVTGGTGSLGPTIIRNLQKIGYRLVVFAKEGFSENSNLRDISIYLGDIKTFSLNDIKESIDVIIHMAGVTPGGRRNIINHEEYENVNVLGTKRLTEQAQRMNIKRIIFFSTINIYGYNRKEILNEDSLPEPRDLYAMSKFEAEKIILNARDKAGNFIGTVLRIAAVYGPQIKGNYYNLVKSISNNRFVPIGKGTNRRTLIYIKDLAQAVVKIIKNESTIGKIYNITDGNIYKMKDIINAIYLALGKKTPNYFIPIRFLRLPLRTYDKAFSILGKRPKLGEWLLDKYTEDIAVSGEKFVRETGFSPSYSLVAGWKETVETMKIK